MLFRSTLEPIIPPCALILDTEEAKNIIKRKNIIFSGPGSKKLHTIDLPEAAVISDLTYSPSDICKLGLQEWRTGSVTDLAYLEPIYIKEFYNTSFNKSEG